MKISKFIFILVFNLLFSLTSEQLENQDKADVNLAHLLNSIKVIVLKILNHIYLITIEN